MACVKLLFHLFQSSGKDAKGVSTTTSKDSSHDCSTKNYDTPVIPATTAAGASEAATAISVDAAAKALQRLSLSDSTTSSSSPPFASSSSSSSFSSASASSSSSPSSSSSSSGSSSSFSSLHSSTITTTTSCASGLSFQTSTSDATGGVAAAVAAVAACTPAAATITYSSPSDPILGLLTRYIAKAQHLASAHLTQHPNASTSSISPAPVAFSSPLPSSPSPSSSSSSLPSWPTIQTTTARLRSQLALDHPYITPCQRQALLLMQREAASSSHTAYPRLLQQFTAWGLDEADLWTCLTYILELAPLLIHIKLGEILPTLVEDTHYRNQFETGTSSGKLCSTSRMTWEDTLFRQAYQEAKPHERPKYGVLNIYNAQTGVHAAVQYGKSYFELTYATRFRATFTPKDSCAVKSDSVGTVEAYAHVMLEWEKEETLHVVEVARRSLALAWWRDRGRDRRKEGSKVVVPLRGMHPPPEKAGHDFKELQIHGPLELGRDMARLVVHPSYRKKEKRIEGGTQHRGAGNGGRGTTFLKLVRRFREKHKVPVVWMDTFEDV